MFHFIKKGKIYEDKLSLYICVKYTFQINVFKKEKKTQNKKKFFPFYPRRKKNVQLVLWPLIKTS